jgi:hypothetical protein
MQWIKENTPENAKFVSDANYGWWFSGFAQRPTISAVDPQYLALSREFEPAQFARYLLDTDYLIDNGLIQVREDGGYISRHNPEILVKLNWTYFPFSFFNLQSNETWIEFEVGGNKQSVDLDQLSVKEMRLENDTEHASVTIVRGNEYFSYTQLTTVHRGLPFVDMAIKLEATAENVSLSRLHMIVQSNGNPITPDRKDTIGFFAEGVKAFGQLIFNETLPKWQNIQLTESSCRILLNYALDDRSQQLKILATVYSVTDDPNLYSDDVKVSDFLNSEITKNLNSAPIPEDEPFTLVFDYQAELEQYGISYIAIRDSDIRLKFLNDPTFNLVFINNDVAIFEVKKQP